MLLFVEVESELACGQWKVLGQAGITHSDSSGSFDLRLPRATLVTVRAFRGTGSTAIATRSVEVDGDEVQLDLTLPE